MGILKEIVKKSNLYLKAMVLCRTKGRGQEEKGSYNFVLGSYVKLHLQVY